MPFSTESRHVRGYGKEWEKLRLIVLQNAHYICQCKHCRDDKRLKPASEVDHIKPKADGGTDDISNLQAINHDCHRRKSAEDRGYIERQKIGADGYPA